MKALESEPDNIELVRSLEQLRRGAGRERDRVATLRRLAKLEGEPETQRALAKEAASIAEMTLADPKLAEEILRELLEWVDADPFALAELTRRREGAGDYEAVVELLLKRAEGESDGAKALELRHRAAEVAVRSLNDKPRAVGFYEEILEQDRSDVRAQVAVRALYGELGKFSMNSRSSSVSSSIFAGHARGTVAWLRPRAREAAAREVRSAARVVRHTPADPRRIARSRRSRAHADRALRSNRPRRRARGAARTARRACAREQQRREKLELTRMVELGA